MSPDTSHACFDCVRVRRVSAFDGRGHEFLARVTNARDTLVTIALIEPVEPAAGPVVPFVLVQGVIKGGGMDEIVRDATMMGAAIIQPVVTAHTAVKPAFAKRAGERRALAPHCHRVGEAVATRDAAGCARTGRSRSRLVGARGGSRIDVRGAVSRPRHAVAAHVRRQQATGSGGVDRWSRRRVVGRRAHLGGGERRSLS